MEYGKNKIQHLFQVKQSKKKKIYIYVFAPQFFEYSVDGEICYNTRDPAGCVVGDNVSTYLTVQLCKKRGQPVPVDQKFVFRKVSCKQVNSSFGVCLLSFSIQM